MAVVTVTVNGRLYDIACEDAQASRVQTLGREIDARAQYLLGAVGAVSDSRLLVMLCLMMADELTEVREQGPGHASASSAAAKARSQALGEEQDIRVAAALDQLAGRIESIAARLERA